MVEPSNREKLMRWLLTISQRPIVPSELRDPKTSVCTIDALTVLNEIIWNKSDIAILETIHSLRKELQEVQIYQNDQEDDVDTFLSGKRSPHWPQPTD